VSAYINRIATAVPSYEVHNTFIQFARTLLVGKRALPLFERMVNRAQIAQRWSCLPPAADPAGEAVDANGFYLRGRFPSTADRMRLFEVEAPPLAAEAVDGLDLGTSAHSISHVIIATCTGFSAPGLDIELIRRCGLNPSVERTMVGFMGCYAAINALKLARHIVRSEPQAKVLVVCIELCTLHLQETDDLEQVLSFLLFGDGCAAALISAEPVGLALERFHAVLVPEAADLISWHIRESGFDMFLSGRVPGALGQALIAGSAAIFNGTPPEAIELWAVHPGGRSVLDAVDTALELRPTALAASRDVLLRFGNMSSATVMFVLQTLMRNARPGALGCGMAFGPGLTAETMLFRAEGQALPSRQAGAWAADRAEA
jgi:predicted naringenin-chalcone synthase